MHRRCIATASLIAALAGASESQTAMVSFVDWYDKFGQKGTLWITAEPGESNDLVVELTGNALGNILDGGRGGDLILGRAGDDRLRGGGHPIARKGFDEWIYGGTGNDEIGSSGGDALLSGGRGRDFLRGGNGRDPLLLPRCERLRS